MLLIPLVQASPASYNIIQHSEYSNWRVASQKTSQPRFDRFFQIILENTDYKVALQQPFMSSLLPISRSYTNMHGVTHPSQPNYIAMVAGDTMGCTDDSKIDITGYNLADLLEHSGKTWKTYLQNYPGNCFTDSEVMQDGLHIYERKHNPFMSFLSISKNATRCANIVSDTQLEADIANKAVPNYVIFTPNQINDGHSADYTSLSSNKTLEYSNARIAVADKWLSTFVPPLVANPYFSDTLFMITFDENDVIFKADTTDNLIYTVVFGAGVQNGTTDNTYYNHYSQLALLESEWGLGSLGRNDATATPFMLSGNTTGPTSKNSAFKIGIGCLILTCLINLVFL